MQLEKLLHTIAIQEANKNFEGRRIILIKRIDLSDYNIYCADNILQNYYYDENKTEMFIIEDKTIENLALDISKLEEIVNFFNAFEKVFFPINALKVLAMHKIKNIPHYKKTGEKILMKDLNLVHLKNLIKYRQTAFEKVKNVLSKSWQDATLNELIFDNTGDCNVIKQKRNLLLMAELELERRQLALE